jgi:prefoldin subunit 5
VETTDILFGLEQAAQAVESLFEPVQKVNQHSESLKGQLRAIEIATGRYRKALKTLVRGI